MNCSKCNAVIDTTSFSVGDVVKCPCGAMVEIDGIASRHPCNTFLSWFRILSGLLIILFGFALVLIAWDTPILVSTGQVVHRHSSMEFPEMRFCPWLKIAYFIMGGFIVLCGVFTILRRRILASFVAVIAGIATIIAYTVFRNVSAESIPDVIVATATIVAIWFLGLAIVYVLELVSKGINPLRMIIGIIIIPVVCIVLAHEIASILGNIVYNPYWGRFMWFAITCLLWSVYLWIIRIKKIHTKRLQRIMVLFGAIVFLVIGGGGIGFGSYIAWADPDDLKPQYYDISPAITSKDYSTVLKLIKMADNETQFAVINNFNIPIFVADEMRELYKTNPKSHRTIILFLIDAYPFLLDAKTKSCALECLYSSCLYCKPKEYNAINDLQLLTFLDNIIKQEKDMTIRSEAISFRSTITKLSDIHN